MRIQILIAVTCISCTANNSNSSVGTKSTSDSINTFISSEDSIKENVEDYDTTFDTTKRLVTEKIGIYDTDVSLQQKFISINENKYSIWSILENVYSDEDHYNEESNEDEGNSITDVNVWQKSYTNIQADCSTRSVILLKRIDNFTSTSYDLIFVEGDGAETKIECKVFLTHRDNTKEQTAKIVTGNSLSENCETLALEYFEKGEDEDDKWSKRTLTFFIASENFFRNVLELDLENHAEFYKDQDTIRRSSTCSFDILPQKTNGLHDIKVVYQTEENNSTKIYRYNRKLYLDN